MHPTSVQTGPKTVDDITIRLDLSLYAAAQLLETLLKLRRDNQPQGLMNDLARKIREASE